jgi:2-polyprenyl-3-methyl-5-hydroxy-6-metoxy-1,4-benzoquinol methylase
VLPYDVVSYGPDIADERVFRLLGNLDGRRVLELGAGGGHAAIAMASQGAKVISVDPSFERLDAVRQAADAQEVKVETQQSELAELAFVRADTIDAVVSIFALASVDDLDRVFRQVHRVLSPECPLVFSLPHPALALVDDDDLTVSHSYFDRTPRPWVSNGTTGIEHPRTVSDVFTSLTRANFRVDTLLEPAPEQLGVRSNLWTPAMAALPATLLIRARKEGS